MDITIYGWSTRRGPQRTRPHVHLGRVKGNVTRIKMIKWQMYGRVNFDLLRKRIGHAA
jgi:hypothetical protein